MSDLTSTTTQAEDAVEKTVPEVDSTIEKPTEINKVENQVETEKKDPTVHASVQPPPASPEIPTPAKINEGATTTNDKENIPPPTTTPIAASPPTTTPIVAPPPPPSVENTIPPHVEKLLMELKHKKEKLRRLSEELFYLQHVNGELAEQTRITHERMLMRQKDQKQLLDNYSDHIRSRRATDDNPQTIHKKLLDLKAMIKSVSVDLAKQCDAAVATQAISSFWVNLHDAIAALGSPLPQPRIELLIEKFMMDVLIQNMNYNAFVGLKISSSYAQLQMWFDRYEPSFSTRFRQEIAKVAVAGNVPGSDIHQEIQKFNKRMYTSLYNSLSQAFPFIEQHDKQQKETSQKYSHQLMSMVELASQIGYAMRGQEIEIAAVAVGEGSESLDPLKMVDEDGQKTGVIQLCICPPFIMYGSRVEILEKARVLCFSINDTVS